MKPYKTTIFHKTKQIFEHILNLNKNLLNTKHNKHQRHKPLLKHTQIHSKLITQTPTTPSNHPPTKFHFKQTNKQLLSHHSYILSNIHKQHFTKI